MILVTGGAGFNDSNFVLPWFKDPATSNERGVNLDVLTYAGNRENLASLEGDARHVFVQDEICNRAQTVCLQTISRGRSSISWLIATSTAAFMDRARS